MKALKNIYLSLGGNKGNTLENLQKAVDLLFERVGHVVKISPVYKTASWGFEGPDFLNSVVHLKTRLSSDVVLKTILEIEHELGRRRNLQQSGYQDRIIDIDLLFYEDEMIKTPSLTIPHPELHKRKFVLQPLYDIAPQLKHPELRKSIEELLQSTSDTQNVADIELVIENPVDTLDFNQFQFITVEGNIGAGKTSLSTMIAEDFNAKLVLERFKENPFLPKFYEDKARYAFPLEMSFLADRYQQLLDDVGQFDLFKNFMIADYDSYKSLIFAQVTLNKEEFLLYKKLHSIMYKNLVKPGLYIYLYQNTERLLENIKKRGRAYEQNISEEYLVKINKAYLDFIHTKARGNIKIIDISALDFVQKRTDYIVILKEICAD